MALCFITWETRNALVFCMAPPTIELHSKWLNQGEKILTLTVHMAEV